MSVEIVPLTPERWPQLAELFGEKGACAGCWCMFPRLTTPEWKAAHATNRRSFQRIVRSGSVPGLLAMEGDRPVGWIAIAPRAEYRRFERSKVLAPVDEKPVWSVPCFFVARDRRGAGLTVRLLRAACAWAAGQGAALVEGYPIEPRAGRLPAAFAWYGLASAFRAAGFREVMRRSKVRPIMRKAVRARGKAVRARGKTVGARSAGAARHG